MRIVTFNVNGLRSIKEYYAVSKGWQFDEFLDSFAADILCLQETKINDQSRMAREYAMPKRFVGYATFQRGAKKIGYSGVVTYCAKGGWEACALEEGFSGLLQAPEDLIMDNTDFLGAFDSEELPRRLDGEGRCVITDHGHFVLMNVYFPNDSGLERNEFRVAFYDAIWKRSLAFLGAGRSVILLGDINVTYHPRDHCDYAKAFRSLEAQLGSEICEALIENHHQRPGAREGLAETNAAARLLIETFYGEKILRSWLYRLLHLDEDAKRFHLQDAFRTFHAGEYETYTCWNTMMSARGTNHGTRIDVILTAGPLFAPGRGVIRDCGILSSVMGSDHCPVYIELDLSPMPDLVVAEPRNLRVHTTQRSLVEFFSRKSESPGDQPSSNAEDKATEANAVPGSAKTKKCKVAKLSLFFEPISRPRPAEEDDTNLMATATLDEEMPEGTSRDDGPSWREIFKPKAAPLCRGHSEPCKLLTVTKRGANQGRKFYTCARGVGARDDPGARCNHFEWFSAGNKNA